MPLWLALVLIVLAGLVCFWLGVGIGKSTPGAER
jgi:hypothetical protein